jgi:glycosyltransferase involved in cell wall biosynthesis
MVTPTFPSQPDEIQGGVMGVSAYLTRELLKLEDVELSVVVLNAAGDESDSRYPPEYRVHNRKKNRFAAFLPGTVYEVFCGKRELSALLRRIRPDLAHFQGCEFLASNCEWPHVATVHGIQERDAITHSAGPLGWLRWSLLKLTEGAGRRNVPNIIVISEYVRKFLEGGNPSQRTWFIENPIAESYFDIEWAGEPGRIFACSSVRPRKNILGLIRAFKRVADEFPASRLRIGGSTTAYPRYVEKCRRYAAHSGLEGRIDFLGNLSVDRVQEELSRSNCLVIPSFQETAPLAVEEAMAVGVPVVASDVGGLSYMVTEGETGFLVAPTDIAGIAAAIGKIVGDRGLTESMSGRAREIARRRFRASAVARKTAEVYREVLAGKAGAG